MMMMMMNKLPIEGTIRVCRGRTLELDTFQPVGPNSKHLTTQLGIIVRDGQRLPPTILDWTNVEQTVKDDIWEEVRRNLVDVPDGYKEVLLKACNIMWKDFKAKTKKKYFISCQDDPNLLHKNPPNVIPHHWHALVAYWRSENVKKQAQQNSQNRDKHGPIHVTGRKSFAAVRHELLKRGQPTDKMSVWTSTRNTSDPDVIQAIKDYNDLLSLEPEDQQHLANIKHKIFHRICGDDGHGYCRTFGASVPPHMVNQGSSMSTNNESMLRQMFQQLEQNIKDHVEKRIEDLRAEFVGGCTDRVTSQSQA